MSERRARSELKDSGGGRLAGGEAVPGAAATAAKPAPPQQMANESGQSTAPLARSGAGFDRSLNLYDYLGESAQEPPKPIELLVKQPGGAQRFEELLKQQDVQLIDQPESQSRSDAVGKQLAGEDKKAQEKLAEEPAGKDQRTGGELKGQVAELSAGAKGERQRSFGASELRAFDTEAPPAEERIVVEASPAEIEKLLAACVADKDYFATTVHDRQEVEQLGANREAAEAPALGKPSSLGGAPGGLGGGVSGKQDKSSFALDAAGDAAKVPDVDQKNQVETRRSGGEPSGGRAWRLPPLASDDASFFGREVNGKAKTEEAIRLRDKNAVSSATAPVGAATNAGAPMALKQLAKEADKPANKRSDKVKVVFVLRRAATPAASSAATATGAAAAPAASSAAPGETTPAKPQ
jgi:hypothetical protein